MRNLVVVLSFMLASSSLALSSDASSGPEVRASLTSFHQALQKRDVTAIEKLVTPELVVFENGERNNGWADFRDNHLIPEMKEPAPESKWEIVRVERQGQLAWGYTSETFTSAKGNKMQLWSIFVLRKEQKDWKIVMLNWSIGRMR